MKEYFKLTSRKILGVIILLFLFSLIGVIPYFSDPIKILTGQSNVFLGWPLVYISIKGTSTNDFNIPFLIIDIIFFYLILCLLAFIFKGRKKQNVPNSNSGGGDTSTSNQTQP